MAVTGLTIQAERWLDEVILYGTVANNAGATISEDFTLPAGLGDVAVMSVTLGVFTIATAPTVPETPRGALVLIVSATGTLVESFGVAQWYWVRGVTTAVTKAAAFVDPDALCLVRSSDVIRVESSELDVDASPTGDFEIIVKCVRVRATVGQQAKKPVKLVR